MSPTRARCVGALVAVAALAVAACTDDVATERADPTSTSTTATPAQDGASTTSTTTMAPPVAWSSCGGGECATVVVPLDHDDPAGGTIELLVKRLPATGDRIGPLFVNFGGPGAPAVDLVESFPIPDSVRSRFDIVAVDPRGVGGSTPLNCGVDPVTLYSYDPTVEDRADAAALVAVSEDYAADCEAERGPLLPHLGTTDVARDMDLIRAGMGDEQLSYLGFSYGTSIGQVYAEQFPDRVRAMILDGVVDPAPSGIDAAVAQARSFEAALADWADGCTERSTCRFDDAIGAVDRMLAAAEVDGGIPSTGGSRRLGPGEAAIALAYPMYLESLWGSLDLALADALSGDGAALVALADQYSTLVDFSIYYAVSCLDSRWPRATEEFLDRAEQAGQDAPHFGEAIVNDYLRCAVWPAEQQPLGAITAPGTPPILVVSSTGDPATPYENGVTVADRLTSGRLLSFDGSVHTIVFQGSGCVDGHAVAYLVDGTVPAEGTRC